MGAVLVPVADLAAKAEAAAVTAVDVAVLAAKAAARAARLVVVLVDAGVSSVVPPRKGVPLVWLWLHEGARQLLYAIQIFYNKKRIFSSRDY